MGDLLKNLQRIGDCELDDITVAHEALAEIVDLRLRIAELVAENQRLREASERVLSALLPGKIIHIGHEHVRYSATYSIAGWNPVLELQALLGGGE